MCDPDWLKINMHLIFLICVQTQIVCNGANMFLKTVPFVKYKVLNQILSTAFSPSIVPFSGIILYMMIMYFLKCLLCRNV